MLRVGLLTAALCALGGPARATPNLDPFRAPSGRVLDPLPAAPGAHFARAQAGTTAAPQSAPPATAPTTACRSDEECPNRTICEDGVCRAFERPINVLLFRKEGPTTVVLPFYFSRRGIPGYRVVAPFYWHLWSPQEKSRIVFPFYWRFEDYLKQRIVTVIGPYAHTAQPDAQSWAVWPLFYRSTRFGWAAPLLASFKIEDPEKGRSLGLYGLLYFWKRSPERAFDLLFPLFVSSRSAEKAFTFALPLNFYWRRGEDRNLLVLPLFYRHAGPETSTLVSPLGYRSRAPGSSRGSVLWLYWYGRGRDSGHDVLFPLVWSFRSPQSNTTIVPPFFHLRRGKSSFSALLPVWFSARNQTAGSAWKLVLPVFFARTTDHGRQSLWLTPIGGYRRSETAGSRALTFLVPPLIYRRNSQYEFSSYLLLYWRYRNLATGATTTLYGPAYSREDQRGSTLVAFPLFWHFREAGTGATAHTFLPLYFRRRSPEETATAGGIFPLWFYHRRFTDGGRSFGLFPLAFFGRRDERRHAMVLPLFYHFADQRSASTLVFPVFYRFAREDSASAGVPPLLYFQGRERRSPTAEDRYYVQFPFFWRFVNGETGARTTVVPPFFYRARPDGWSAGLAPVLFAGGGGPRKHFVVFPLLWRFRDDDRDRGTTVFLNYLHRRHGGEVTDALFPLFHYRRGARPGAAPETRLTLFPLFHYRSTPERADFVSPLAAWTRNPHRKAGMVPPYFWYQDRQLAARGLFPFYLDLTRLQTGERTRLIGPWAAIDAPGRRARVLFPLWARYHDEQETGTYVFPTYFRRRTHAGYALDTVFPLFWRSRWPGHTSTMVGPFFRRTGPGAHLIGLAPLFVYSHNPKRRFLVTPLFFRHTNFEAGTHRSFAYLYYGSWHRDGHRTVVFPLWWAGRNKEKSHRMLFPVYWRFANDKEDRAFNLLGPFLWSHHGSRRTRGLVPVAWYSRDPEKRTAANAVLPLFYERHGPRERMFFTLPFGYKSAPDRWWFYVPPLFYKDGWKSSFWTLFPAWFQHTDKVTETRTRIVPPLLHYSRSSPDKALSGLLLLFWRHRSITSSTWLGLPLYYDVHSYHDRRFTLLIPLFLRFRNEVANTSTTFAPLFYRRTSPVDSTTVLFPLLWDFRGADRRTTVVFPLYVGIRRDTWRGHFVFPNIWYRTGLGPEAGTSRLFVFPLWESAVKRRGDYMWEVLLGLVGWERIGRNRFLKLFFIPIELEPAPAARTAWYGREPRRSRHRPRGVSATAW